MSGHRLGCRFTYVSDSQCEQNSLERCLFRIFQALEETLGSTVLPAVKPKQVFLFELIEVCRIPYKAFIVKLFDRSITGNYIHSLSAEEMYQFAFDLRWTSRLIRTECLCFLLIPHEYCAAVRACYREMWKNCICRSLR